MKYILIFCAVLLCPAVKLCAFDLHSAVQRGDINAVQQAIALRPESINATDPASGGTPLLLAAMSGNIGIVELLVENGAEINLASKGVTPLHGAAYKGHTSVALYLVAGGADMSAKTLNGLTPAAWAKRQGNTQLAEQLEKAASLKKGEAPTPPIPRRTKQQATQTDQTAQTPSQTRDTLDQGRDKITELEKLRLELAQSERTRIENEVISRANLEKLRKAKDAEIAELESMIVEMEQTLEEEKKAAGTAQALERRLAIMARRLQRSEERRIEVEKRYKNNIAGIEAARDKAFSEFREQISRLKAAESALRADYAATRRETTRLKEELSKITNELESAAQRYEQLQKKYEAGIDAVQQSRDRALSDMNSELAEIREAETALRLENLEKENLIANLKEQVAYLRESLSGELPSYIPPPGLHEISELRNEIFALKTDLDMAKLEKETLLDELEKTRNENAELMRQTAAMIRTMQTPGRDTPLPKLPDTAETTEPDQVIELGSRIVKLALKMKETILAAESDPELEQDAQEGKTGMEFGASISYRQDGSDGVITDFEAELVEIRPEEKAPENETETDP